MSDLVDTELGRIMLRGYHGLDRDQKNKIINGSCFAGILTIAVGLIFAGDIGATIVSSGDVINNWVSWSKIMLGLVALAEAGDFTTTAVGRLVGHGESNNDLGEQVGCLRLTTTTVRELCVQMPTVALFPPLGVYPFIRSFVATIMNIESITKH